MNNDTLWYVRASHDDPDDLPGVTVEVSLHVIAPSIDRALDKTRKHLAYRNDIQITEVVSIPGEVVK